MLKSTKNNLNAAIFFIAFIFLTPLLEAYVQKYDKCFINSNSENKICYIFVPKNGSSSLKRVLNTRLLVSFSKIEKNKNLYNTIFCIRDPMYRPISIYNEIMKLRLDGEHQITRNSNFYSNRESLCLSFKLFLEFIENNFYDSHISHQYLFLEKKNLSLSDLEFILFFENLSDDLKSLSLILSTNLLEKHLNGSESETKQTLKNYIDKSISVQKQIRKLWEKDFILYEKAKLYKKSYVKL